MWRADAFEGLLPVLGPLGIAEADLAECLRKLAGEEVQHLLGIGGAAGPLDAGIDVLGVLAEDHHVHFAWLLDRRGHALEPAHRPQADVQVEHLAQRDVQ